MQLLEIYKGVDIYFDKKDEQRPYIVIQAVPVIGVLQTGHKTLEDAKNYIDKTT